MGARKNVSPGALLLAVLVALVMGFLGSLAVRPPGAVAESRDESLSGGLEPVRWRLTSSFTSNLPIVGPPPQRIADNLAAMSGGAFQITAYDPGEIVPALEITESIKEGKVEAGFQWPHPCINADRRRPVWHGANGVFGLVVLRWWS